jgi:hypothetical protein
VSRVDVIIRYRAANDGHDVTKTVWPQRPLSEFFYTKNHNAFVQTRSDLLPMNPAAQHPKGFVCFVS